MQFITKNGMVYDSANNVGVLYSKAYRYKWNTVTKEHLKLLMFYPPLILYLVDGNSRDLVNESSSGLTDLGKELIQDLIIKTGKRSYFEDIKYLAIKWVPAGKMIRSIEVDGYEKIELFDESDWIQIPEIRNESVCVNL